MKLKHSPTGCLGSVLVLLILVLVLMYSNISAIYGYYRRYISEKNFHITLHLFDVFEWELRLLWLCRR